MNGATMRLLYVHQTPIPLTQANTVHVMSPRPGKIIYSKRIDLPRPRTLETTFTPEFVEIVHSLREQISHEQDL